VSSLKYFQHILLELEVIDEDEHFFFLQSANERDPKKYLLRKNSKNKIYISQTLKVSAVPILSEQGVELYDVKFK
jgi:hypothetical protein